MHVDFVVVTEGGITKRSKRGERDKIVRKETRSKQMMDSTYIVGVSG